MVSSPQQTYGSITEYRGRGGQISYQSAVNTINATPRGVQITTGKKVANVDALGGRAPSVGIAQDGRGIIKVSTIYGIVGSANASRPFSFVSILFKECRVLDHDRLLRDNRPHTHGESFHNGSVPSLAQERGPPALYQCHYARTSSPEYCWALHNVPR